MGNGWLERFRSLTWIEQIEEIDRVEREGEVERVSELAALSHDPTLSGTVERALHEAVLALLSSDAVRLRDELERADEVLLPFCLQAALRAGDPGLEAGLLSAFRRAQDPKDGTAALMALSRIGSREAMPVFREAVSNPDPLVRSVAIDALGRIGDRQSVETLQDLVRRETAGVCSLDTAQAVEALGRIGSTEALVFLVDNVHHPNPTVRRLVQEALVARGDDAVPHLLAVMETGGTDERVLAANALGLIGTRCASDALVDAMDRGWADHPNVRAAVYEGLGGVASLKAIVCLIDGLLEPDEITLLAVVSALERDPTDLVVDKVAQVLGAPEQGERVARALVTTGCGRLVARLYEREQTRQALDRALDHVASPDAAEALAQALERSGAPGAAQAAARLRCDVGGSTKGRVLIADDARSVRYFYEAVLRQEGWEVITVEDGKAAWDRISRGEPFDLLITDLNMPRMDGIELVTRLRNSQVEASTPVVMVTTESESDQIHLARTAGVDAFLTKPVAADVLSETVERLASQRS